MMIQQKKLVIAVACAVSLGVSTAQAADFTATATLENTLTVSNITEMDLGTVFATVTGDTEADGVGALVMSPAGVVTTAATTSASVKLISLVAGTGAQGSVDMANDFTLTLPATNSIAEDDFDDGANTLETEIAGSAIELRHDSANPDVPSLYLMHFTIEDVSGGTSVETATHDGDFTITPGFGGTTYVFNIGGTITTEPKLGTGGAEENYQTGAYAGTFLVTASY
jgi:hypothetical protein